MQLAYRWWQSGQAVLLDIRTNAERAWVGFIPEVPAIEWKIWPDMEINPDFDRRLKELVTTGSRIVMLCRSGLRSVPSSQRAQNLGYQAYNIVKGFEGDPDTNASRGKKADGNSTVCPGGKTDFLCGVKVGVLFIVIVNIEF